ncbi:MULTISPECIES: Fur family transcriptional regulator [unclassified Ectothiorhodospira]|uniref:Fur family transcriptional regulator n=1 Tax=unclassified Ectothiorhodospira TaxID=2684909 RepID=UPI001EE7C28D|nr:MULTISPECIES: Fur family transcriptional regulator [unclassified Ectothiorhodospira]MCG5516183.1 transcriptional repressor [Ectothiorhodospira sp. 9100]MCG5519589.1 transcriptional repressor [Ectothiorhodospira sp. 9905]
MPDREAVVKRLRDHGITPTQQRLDIAELLFERPQHVSAEQLLALASERRYQVSKATVYNTLGLFAEKGLVREVVVDPAKLFYDSNLEPHHHMYHMDSGHLEDLALEHVDIGALPDLPEGVRVEGVDVIVRVRQG